MDSRCPLSSQTGRHPRLKRDTVPSAAYCRQRQLSAKSCPRNHFYRLYERAATNALQRPRGIDDNAVDQSADRLARSPATPLQNSWVVRHPIRQGGNMTCAVTVNAHCASEVKDVPGRHSSVDVGFADGLAARPGQRPWLEGRPAAGVSPGARWAGRPVFGHAVASCGRSGKRPLADQVAFHLGNVRHYGNAIPRRG